MVGVAACVLLPSLFSGQVDARSHYRVCHGCRRPVLLDPDAFEGPTGPFKDGPFGNPPDVGSDLEPPMVPEPSPAPGPLRYPQGFALDVPVHPRADGSASGAIEPTRPLRRYREVADALAGCWNPPAMFGDTRWNEATLRVSFKRDGSINGLPRIPHTDEGLTATARSDLTQSLEAALRACTPLPLSSGLGAAIAGQIFALRFIEQDANDDR